MTPPTSNSSAMSQELSEEKLREIGAVAQRCVNLVGRGEWYVARDELADLAPSIAGLVTALLSAQRKNEELVRALTEIRDFPIGDVYKNQIAANMAITARQALRPISEEK